MSKKKAVAKKAPNPTPARSQKSAKAKRTSDEAPASAPLSPANTFHVFRHEIDGNPTNGPLVVEIPIAAGRGDHPQKPSFVGFSAEMSDEHWPDQFAFRIISLDATTVRVMVSRVDKDSPDMGWGVTLVVHVLVCG